MKRGVFKQRSGNMKRTPLAIVSRKTKTRDSSYRNALPINGLRCWCCWNAASQRHHIYQKSECPHMVKEPLNMLPVCGFCHSSIHDNGEGTFRETLRRLEPERMRLLDVMAKQEGKSNQFRSFE